MKKPPDYPALHRGQHVVVCAEAATGIILSTRDVWWNKLSDTAADKYRVFSSLAEAVNFGTAVVAKHPDWEAAILDHAGVEVQLLVVGGSSRAPEPNDSEPG